MTRTHPVTAGRGLGKTERQYKKIHAACSKGSTSFERLGLGDARKPSLLLPLTRERCGLWIDQATPPRREVDDRADPTSRPPQASQGRSRWRRRPLRAHDQHGADDHHALSKHLAGQGGVSSRNGKNRTLRICERPQRPKFAGLELARLPDVIACQVNVLPAEWRDVAQQAVIYGHAVVF